MQNPGTHGQDYGQDCGEDESREHQHDHGSGEAVVKREVNHPIPHERRVTVRITKVKIRPEALAALSQVPEVKKQVRAVAAQIRDDARSLAPVESGALRRGITVVNVYDPEKRAVVYRVGWRMDIAWYGGLVEFGTEDTPPRPHLRPAALRRGGRLRGR